MFTDDGLVDLDYIAGRTPLELGREIAALRQMWKRSPLHIVFDGPPGHNSGRFVEVETPEGKSLSAGEWVERSDGYWELRLA
jgi:hypothetical protein